jgi:hypothetical protein
MFDGIGSGLLVPDELLALLVQKLNLPAIIPRPLEHVKHAKADGDDVEYEDHDCYYIVPKNQYDDQVTTAYLER